MEGVPALIAFALGLGPVFALHISAQEVLPFPRTPSDSTAGRTMQESIYKAKDRVAFNGTIQRVQVKYGNVIVVR